MILTKTCPRRFNPARGLNWRSWLREMADRCKRGRRYGVGSSTSSRTWGSALAPDAGLTPMATTGQTTVGRLRGKGP
jgi:hypothetical protein